MNYRLVIVVGPDHPLAGVQASPDQLRDQTWLLGPSAAADLGAVPALLRRLAVPEDRQQIFQSHAAALEEAKRGKASRRRCRSLLRRTSAGAIWCCWPGRTRPSRPYGIRWMLAKPDTPSAAAELSRFASTPRAIQAMMRGAGVNVGRFKPSVHVTLWS